MKVQYWETLLESVPRVPIPLFSTRQFPVPLFVSMAMLRARIVPLKLKAIPFSVFFHNRVKLTLFPTNLQLLHRWLHKKSTAIYGILEKAGLVVLDALTFLLSVYCVSLTFPYKYPWFAVSGLVPKTHYNQLSSTDYIKKVTITQDLMPC